MAAQRGEIRRFELDRPLDLGVVLGPLHRGAGDPTMRLGRGEAARASWLPSGAATVVIRSAEGRAEIEAEGWGPGAEEALARVPALVGLNDDDAGFDPSLHPEVAALARRLRGVRLGRTGSVFEALVPAILEQRITGTEAWRGFRRLVRKLAVPAPGELGLWMPARAADVVALPSWTFPALGIEPRRGTLLRRIAADAPRLEALAARAREPGGGGRGAAELDARLRAYPGIGPWTSAEVRLRALGDPDAVSLADAHLPNVVAWILAGEPRATDERMLELLAPWAGHRARVIRLLELSGKLPPRFGPRIAPRDLTDLTPRR
ncbi:MAG: DNA-3-methyladenine glycosylase 2 family protein [Chloroflexi bacterium]|nr:DNA-3-methyladenine glycosylase 2 family protein [Chloroflexota bacterium]